VPAPDELVGWFQHHPYLKTSRPSPVTVGGVKGKQFDVVLANRPRNHKGVCGNTTHCLDILALSTGGPSEVFYTNKTHYIVLKDVKSSSTPKRRRTSTSSNPSLRRYYRASSGLARESSLRESLPTQKAWNRRSE
jgi:hypothetical protein